MNKLLTSGADANEKLDQLLTLFDERVPALHGELTPAEEASPPLPQSCPATVPDNALRVYFGSDVGIATQFPVTVLQIGDKPQISFDRSGTNIQISAEVYSRDKRIIARIHNNKFDINPNNYFRIEQDPHTLTVFDQENDMVLSVHFANAHAVKVTGRFAMPNGRTLLVKDEGALVMPNNISIGGNCFEGVAILFKF
ncbi:MAG: hypothetical protein P4N59_04690 [Negativicutes bacterium]|nr:hypothetical protein [Negativicutes bacterium]